MTPQEFVRKWKAVELTERAAAQSHFIDLCRVFDHPTPADVDKTGDTFAFEKGLTKSGGGEGFADVWKRGFFAWEYKKKRRNLDAALEQLSRYAAALEYPPLHVVCDMDRLVIVTAWTNNVPERHTIHLDDLALPENYEKVRAIFHDPERLRPQKTRQAVTAEAATKFVTVAERLQHRVPDSEAVAHFINQLVFCFFAEDVRLLPEGFFTRILQHAAERPGRGTDYLNRLFEAMEAGGEFDLTSIRHFNGGLFDGRRALTLEPDEFLLLVEAGALDWGQIDPTIFGTLFERFLDPEKRAQIGAHYTDTDKIMMIVEPVIMRPLRREWDEAKADIAKIVSRTVGLGRQAYRNAIAKAEERRAQFLERLRTLSILDPACGSGNFLYLALQGVKDLEQRAILECEALGLSPQAPVVGPEILHGIEINRHAAELARTTIWIGHIQWAIRNGIRAWPSPVLKKLDTIEARDALIERDPETGEWREAKWPKAEFIVGNPPFLGGKLLRKGLGGAYVETLFEVYRERVPPEADLVVYWALKSFEAVRAQQSERAGLVTTNSIRGGASRRVVDAIVAEALLFEAWSDESWIVEGAAVRVSLLCFGRGETQARLDGESVARISADLAGAATDLTTAIRLRESESFSFQGVTKGAPFEVSREVAESWLLSPLNPNGCSNADVLRPIFSGGDIVRRNPPSWVIDFSERTRDEASLYELPFEYAKANVEPARAINRRERYREYWWLFAEGRPGLWTALDGLSRYIATPKVSRHRVFVWRHPIEIPDNLVIAIAKEDDTFIGMLHSRFHEAWSLRRGAWIGVGNDPTYTPTTTFETFPFPEGLTPNIPASDYADDPRAIRIAAAAKRLDDLRNAWLNPPDLIDIVPEVVPGYPDRILPKNADAEKTLKERTLTKLYNARPQWLADAHADLDRAVGAAYGWPEDISTDDALAKLLELNLKRAAAGR